MNIYDFKVLNQSGEEVSLEEYRGKNIIGPKSVIYDNTTVDGELLPEKLEKRIFNNPEVFTLTLTYIS